MIFNQKRQHQHLPSSSRFGVLKTASKVFGGMIVPALFSAFAYSANTQDERWFEIEVIIFSQLGDKKALAEKFPTPDQQESILPKYNKISEILTHHFYPDVSLQRSQLPQCGQTELNDSLAFFNHYPDFVTLKPLSAFIEPSDLFNDTSEALTNDVNDEEVLSDQVLVPSTPLNNNSEKVDRLIEKYNQINQNELGSNQLTMQKNDFDFTLPIPNSSANNSLGLIPELSSKEVDDIENLPLAFQGSLSLDLSCTLPLSMDNKYPLEVNGAIDGNGNTESNVPYLIAKESLQLTDMYQRLKWSKSFKPLLHLGWREAPQSRRQATAFHLFAGENLAYNYDKAMKQFELERLKLTNQIEDDKDLARYTDEAQLALQNSINDITNSIQNISDSNEKEILSELDLNPTINNINDNQNNELQPPIKPLQPWALDGLFRVHLNHYLYITADFNVLNLTPKEQKQQESFTSPIPLKSINFSQNRRVISGEIHYFDHPYMGMIVQIRKYQRPTEEIID